ncbi:hypothetical protein FIBSPDRAFT_852046, partial [Athelia psychrophila]
MATCLQGPIAIRGVPGWRDCHLHLHIQAQWAIIEHIHLASEQLREALQRR